MQLWSRTDESEPLDITALLRASQDAGRVLEDWQTRYLESILTTTGLPDALRFTLRLTRSSIVIELISSEPLSTSPERPATPARS